MGLKLPTTIKQVASDKRHPYFNSKIDLMSLYVTVDGVQPARVMVADAINGYIEKQAIGSRGEPVVERLKNGVVRPKKVIVRGTVQIWRKSDVDTPDT